ncbi:hypothetical protein TWF696_009680 [Orbilia brochopaga]|uniref:Uncharacterized protein n=1 Tax=Orbilia brochopaga TaxID=3140254 RepID=A0AAV9UC89_9PEZI
MHPAKAKAPPPAFLFTPSCISPLLPSNMSAGSTSLPIPAPERPRNLSVFDIPFDEDFVLYDEDCDDDMSVDLDDITTRGVSKASSFAHQEYKPSMLMYHPHDAKSATYPAPFDWEKQMFDDLANEPRARSPSVSSVNTTAATAPDSRRGSLQLPGREYPPCSCSCSRRSTSSHADYSVRSSRRDSAAPHAAAHKRFSALLTNFSFHRSNESPMHSYPAAGCSQDIAPSSRRSSKTCLSIPFTATSSTPTTATGSTASRRYRRRGSRGSALLLSHIGAGHSHYRMDNRSGDLQQVVADIPVSAFIHPKMRFPDGDERVECGPVEEDGVFEDAYPLRVTRLWSFDEMSSHDMYSEGEEGGEY